MMCALPAVYILLFAICCPLSRQALLCDLARPKVRVSAVDKGISAPTPAILGIHGGCWRGGHKRDTSTIVVSQWAQQFGFCAMSMNASDEGIEMDEQPKKGGLKRKLTRQTNLRTYH